MAGKGQPAVYLKCLQCRRPVKRNRAELKRRASTFCSKPCYHRFMREYAAHCQREFAQLNPEVYAELVTSGLRHAA
jgi:hypothetical protein